MATRAAAGGTWDSAPDGRHIEGASERPARLMGEEPGTTSARRFGLIIIILVIIGVVLFIANQILTGAWRPNRGDSGTNIRPDQIVPSNLSIPDGLLISRPQAQVVTLPGQPAPPPVTLPGAPSAAQPASVDDDLLRLARLRREQLLAALGAPSGVDVPGDAGQRTRADTATAARRGGGSGLPGGQSSADYLPYGLTPALSAYEIKAGAVVPAAMITGINSDLPSEIIAQTTEPVFDSVSGRTLLLPRGSRLVGLYNNDISFGQERVQIVWNRVILPDGSSLKLDAMNGVDALGQAGVTGEVNNHWGKIFGAAVLTSVFSIGYELLTETENDIGREEDAVRDAVGNNFFNTANEVVQRNLAIPPTIEVAPGALFNILVNKDMVFPGPYEDGLTSARHSTPAR